MPAVQLPVALATSARLYRSSPIRLRFLQNRGNGRQRAGARVIINAIVDALSELGVRHIEMPATSHRCGG
jgi:hypothetical protein